MAPLIDERLRRLVAKRARYRCEYCLIYEEDSFSKHQIDHIISRKHGGSSEKGNLAFACVRCNAWKGTDIAAVDQPSGELVRLFHPRRDRWALHFRLEGIIIDPLTAQGRVTARLLRLNIDQRIVERRLLSSIGRYPALHRESSE